MKARKEMMKNNNMDAIKFNLKRQNKQADAMIKLIERMEQTERNVERTESKVDEKYEEVKGMVNEVKDRVHIDFEDQKQLQSIVAKKSNQVAKEYYNNSEEYGAEIRELIGYARRYVWKQLKDYFNVTRYTSIRHVDREEAKELAETIELDQPFLQGYEKWKYQRAKKRERELAKFNSKNN